MKKQFVEPIISVEILVTDEIMLNLGASGVNIWDVYEGEDIIPD